MSFERRVMLKRIESIDCLTRLYESELREFTRWLNVVGLHDHFSIIEQNGYLPAQYRMEIASQRDRDAITLRQEFLEMKINDWRRLFSNRLYTVWQNLDYLGHPPYLASSENRQIWLVSQYRIWEIQHQIVKKTQELDALMRFLQHHQKVEVVQNYANRLHAILISIYPRSFQAEHGDEIRYTFHDDCEDAYRSGGYRKLIRVIIYSLVFLLIEGLRERAIIFFRRRS